MIVSLSIFIFSTSVYSSDELTQEERTKITAQLVPVILMLLDGSSLDAPTLTNPISEEVTSDSISVEVHGKVGAKVYVNGVEVGTIASNGKTTIVLTFINGVNAMTITLKDQAGNESDGFTFSVSYDAPPVITIVGDTEQYLAKGDTFIDLGATAIDANDGASLLVTAGTVDTDIIGEYNITYTAIDDHGNIASKIRKVHVIQVGVTVEVLPMDITKVEGYDEATDLTKLVGIVKNQYWIQDFGTLSEAELTGIVADYPIVTVIGYSDTYGLLVEIPENSAEANSAIKSIELKEKVVNVRHRVYIGSDTISTNSITIPNDDVSGYNDDGDNWHLEYINILDAWEITTGSSEVAIGVVDNGFYANHEDITIKDGNLFTIRKSAHGTAVSSVIAANTNNNKGITGINWESPMVADSFLVANGKAKDPVIYYNNIFTRSDEGDNIKLVNCSWDYTVADHGQTTKEEANLLYSRENDVIRQYKNKLFVYAAGNSSIDTELENGMRHLKRSAFGFYTNNQNRDNVLIVAALLKDSTLPYYSNYGGLVDIAAPTAMKTAKSLNEQNNIYNKIAESKYYGTDNNKSRNSITGVFNGTSAAAPVVTGVASLIYSLNPEFTPQEVKKILIDSSTNFVCMRHTAEAYTDENENLLEPIPGGCIPILNAGAALRLAKEIVDAKKASLSHYYPSAFSNMCNVYIKIPAPSLRIESLDLSVQGKMRSDGIWENITVYSSSNSLTKLVDSTHELAFFTDKKYAEYNVTGTLTYEGYASIEVSLIVPHTIVETYIEVKDKLSQESLDNTEMSINYMNIEGKYVTKIDNDVDDHTTLYLETGTDYKVIVKKDDYKPYTEYLGFGNSAELFQSSSIELLSSTSDALGAMGGRVLSEDGDPIGNASVALVSPTGIVQTQDTQNNGIYRVLDIPILDDSDAFIAYSLEITHPDYLTTVLENIGLADGQIVTENIVLKKDPNDPIDPPGPVDDYPSSHTTTTTTLATTKDGKLEVENDIDAFKIIIEEDAILTLYTTGLLDTKGALYNDYGSLLADVDDDTDGNLNFKIIYTVTAGVYYLDVSAYGDGTGSYTVHKEIDEISQDNTISEFEDKVIEWTEYVASNYILGNTYRYDAKLALYGNGYCKIIGVNLDIKQQNIDKVEKARIDHDEGEFYYVIADKNSIVSKPCYWNEDSTALNISYNDSTKKIPLDNGSLSVGDIVDDECTDNCCKVAKLSNVHHITADTMSGHTLKIITETDADSDYEAELQNWDFYENGIVTMHIEGDESIQFEGSWEASSGDIHIKDSNYILYDFDGDLKTLDFLNIDNSNVLSVVYNIERL